MESGSKWTITRVNGRKVSLHQAEVVVDPPLGVLVGAVVKAKITTLIVVVVRSETNNIIK